MGLFRVVASMVIFGMALPIWLNGQPGYREALLQRLIHAALEGLPIRAIDPVFMGLRAVCTELPLREDVERFADNFLINPDGRICLVEC